MSDLPASPTPDHRVRPSGAIGPAVVLSSFACFAAAVVTQSGWAWVPFLALFVVGMSESFRSFDGWLLARRLRGTPAIAVRGLLRSAVVALPGVDPDAHAVRMRHRLAAVNDFAWCVRAPVRLDVNLKLERRGLLSRGGKIGDDAFDSKFSLTARDVDDAHLAAMISQRARVSLERLFGLPAVQSITVADGELRLFLARRRDDPAPVLAVLDVLPEVIEELGRRPEVLPSISSLRAHSPDGNPVGG